MGEREGGEGRQEGRAQSPAIVRPQCRWFVVLLNALAASAVLVSIVLHCRVGASGPLQNSGTMLGGSEAAFPIKQHLSSVTRYDDAVKLVAAANVGQPNSVPDYCRPVHLNLLARHGSRNPTKKRINEMNWLVHRLKAEVVRLKAGASREYEESRAAKKGRTDEGRGRGEGSVAQAPTLTNATRVEELGWIEDYRSPWEGGAGAGYLVPGGEEEMFGLAQRLRARFPEVFSAEYDPDVYSIHGTQVPRAASSAVAFGLGLFEGQGQLGTGRQRAFAVVSDTKETDRRLRFHKTCPAYKAHKKAHKPAVRRIQSEAYRTAAAGLRTRYGLNLSADDAAGVWLLCKQEAALLGQTQRACSLLAENEVALLEWADDVEMHQLKGYGAPINYRMARPLLQDVVTSMERAAAAAAVKAQQIPGSCAQCERDEGDIAHGEGDATQGQGDASPAVERARLRFAHAETVVPLACILGLFMENVTRDLALVAAEERLPTPPRPPHHRAWHGSLVAPFGANTAIVLFDCGGVERAASQGIATQRVLGTARSDVLSESRSERLGQRTECGEIPPGSDFGDDDEDGDLENGDGAFQGHHSALALGASNPAVAAAGPPTSTPVGDGSPGASNCTDPCPSSPFELCDFYIEGGNGTALPALALGDGQADLVIGGPILSNLDGGEPVQVYGTNAGFCLLSSDDDTAGSPGDPSTQFYATNVDGEGYVATRIFNVPERSFCGQCIMLPLTAIALPPAVHLNEGDNNLAYPEARRCVTFTTSCGAPQPAQAPVMQPPTGPLAPTSAPQPAPALIPLPNPTGPVLSGGQPAPAAVTFVVPGGPAPATSMVPGEQPARAPATFVVPGGSPAASPSPSTTSSSTTIGASPSPTGQPLAGSSPNTSPGQSGWCAQDCGSHPLDACEFYFAGSKDTTPKLTLGLGLNQAISPAIVSNIDGGQPVEVDTAFPNPCFIATAAQSRYTTPTELFFISVGGIGHVAASVFSQPRPPYCNQCVNLPLTSVRLPSSVILSPGDENQKYPQARRCVTFHTVCGTSTPTGTSQPPPQNSSSYAAGQIYRQALAEKGVKFFPGDGSESGLDTTDTTENSGTERDFDPRQGGGFDPPQPATEAPLQNDTSTATTHPPSMSDPAASLGGRPAIPLIPAMTGPVAVLEPNFCLEQFCPSSPLAYCDFYFAGSLSSVPTFDLGSSTADTTISSAIVSDPDQGLPIIATGPAGGFCLLSTNGFPGRPGVPPDQLYATNVTSQGRVGVRERHLDELCGHCVLLSLTDIQLPSSNTLTPGDGNILYEEPRRCVVFNTACNGSETEGPSGDSA